MRPHVIAAEALVAVFSSRLRSLDSVFVGTPDHRLQVEKLSGVVSSELTGKAAQ